MAEPKSYPTNDSAETRSVNLIESLLDPDFVKTQFAKRDKAPNIDGSLELVDTVDGSSRPVGKLDVQIKTLPTGELKFQCPSSLVAYSRDVTALPVLLICADAAKGKAYWKHVHVGMPEFKEGQETFVVKFDPEVEVIDARRIYFSQWRDIVNKNLARRVEATVLKQAIRIEVALVGLGRAQVIRIQYFVDRLNSLLDGELRFVKDICFPGAWKLGIAVQVISAKEFSYLIYTVPYGSGSPLIVNITGRADTDVFESLRAGNPDPAGLREYGEQRLESHRYIRSAEDFDPLAVATDCILGYLNGIVSQRRLPVSGRMTATEVLFRFINAHGHAAGLATADRYEVSDLNYALKVFFPAWIRLGHGTFMHRHRDLVMGSNVWPDLTNITGMLPRSARPTDEQVRELIQNGKVFAGPLLIRGANNELGPILDAVDLLLDEEIQDVVRIHSRRANQPGMIWDGYPEGEAERRLQLLVDYALPEYQALLARIGFRPPKSRWREEKLSAYLIKWTAGESCMPIVEHVALAVPTGLAGMRTAREWSFSGTEASVDGITGECIGRGEAVAGGLFSKTPLLDTVYAMLQEDLRLSYPHFRHWKSDRSIL